MEQRIKKGDKIIRTTMHHEFNDNDPERELIINKEYEVEEDETNGIIKLKGFTEPVRVCMLRKVSEAIK